MQEGGGFRLPSLDSPSYPLTPFHSRRQSRPCPPPAPKRRARLGSRGSPGLIVNERKQKNYILFAYSIAQYLCFRQSFFAKNLCLHTQ